MIARQLASENLAFGELKALFQTLFKSRFIGRPIYDF